MKFNLLLIFSFLACYTLSAQSYLPIEFGDTKWQVTETTSAGQGSFNYYAKDSLKYTFDGRIHYRVQKQLTQNYIPAVGGFYLSNDTAGKKVYFFSVVANKDYLLYDFDVSVGDTINTVFNQPNILDTVLVDSIQNISVNGVQRKHVFVHSLVANTGAAKAWIEGIGSSGDLLYPSQVLPNNTYTLDCQEYNMTRNFGTQFSCTKWVTAVRDFSKSLIQVYPNPAVHTLHINSDKITAARYTVKVFNLQSKVVAKYDQRIESAFTLDISQLNGGVYFLSLQSAKGDIFYSKFLKQ